jgi:cysteine desulfurase
MTRVYLDYNATTPLRPQARAAMIAAMDVMGNPSSIHAEGRAAKALLERSRAQLGDALGAQNADIVFVSGATEGAALACAGQGLAGADIEHDAVRAWIKTRLPVSSDGQVQVDDAQNTALQLANSETGILQSLPNGLRVSDWSQAFGKMPLDFDSADLDMALVSAHKIGGPKGVGALILRPGLDIAAQIKGGGQEMGRRAGTENIIGIAGFGGAVQAATQDIEDGVWEDVKKLRNILEKLLDAGANKTIFVGKGVSRLPNTSCIITPGWKGETQVIQMDLAGFAISAGSACSSGKVKSSAALQAMGFDAQNAACAIRVSLAPQTTQAEVTAFATAWIKARDRFFARAM